MKTNICVFVAIGVARAAGMAFAGGTYDVRSFGAKGNGLDKDTTAIQSAIDAASAAGGGEVFFGAGTYVSGSIFLRSNVDFHLGPGATLLGSPDKTDYNAADVCSQNTTSKPESSFGAHLVLCIEQENVTVRGPGRIDGNSAVFLVDPKTGVEWGHRPGNRSAGQDKIPWRPSQMLYFVESRNLRIQDLELSNSTYWSCFLFGCEQVAVRGLYVHNERDRFHTCNGDGLDIDCCEYVTVSDCRICTADDCITLRASGRRLKRSRDCAHVMVSNCSLSSPCNCVRVGVGEGCIHDAVFSNVVAHDARTAIDFVSSWRAQATKGVDIRNIRFMNWIVDCQILFHLHGGPLASGVTREAVTEDLSFVGFSGRASGESAISGLPNSPARRLLFRDIDVLTKVLFKDVDGVCVDGGLLRPEGGGFCVR